MGFGQVNKGTVSLNLGLDQIYTLTTITDRGSKGTHPTPPISKPFPLPYSDDYESNRIFTTCEMVVHLLKYTKVPLLQPDLYQISFTFVLFFSQNIPSIPSRIISWLRLVFGKCVTTQTLNLAIKVAKLICRLVVTLQQHMPLCKAFFKL